VVIAAEARRRLGTHRLLLTGAIANRTATTWPGDPP
jgi:hypothetical protein